jgi:hypothetical protein
MTGRIPIYRDAHLVGHVVWVGTMAAGQWRFVVNRKVADPSKERSAVQLAFDRRQDLQRRQFAGPGERTYRGWHGFPGVLGAFTAALPAVGLRVDRSATVWPTKKSVEDLRGAVIVDWRAERAADLQAQPAGREKAIRDFRERIGETSV